MMLVERRVFVLPDVHLHRLQLAEPCPGPAARVDPHPDRQRVHAQARDRVDAGKLGRAAGRGDAEDHVPVRRCSGSMSSSQAPCMIVFGVRDAVLRRAFRIR